MRPLVVLLPILFIGCSDQREFSYMDIDDHGTYNYFIPDSNKEKYSEFVSRSVSSCLSACDDLYWRTKQTGGELYGNRRYTVVEYYGSVFDRKIITKELAVEEMNERQLEYFKKYFQ